MAASREGISDAYAQLLDVEERAAANPDTSRIMLVSGVAPNGLIQSDVFMDALASLPGHSKELKQVVVARNELRRERQALVIGHVPVYAIVSSSCIKGVAQLAEPLIEGFRALNTRDKVTVRRTEHFMMPTALRDRTMEIVSTPDGHSVYFENARTRVVDGRMIGIVEEYEPIFMGPEDPKSVGFANMAALALGTAVGSRQSW